MIIDAQSRPGNLGRQSIFVASDELIDACDDDDLASQLAHDQGEIIRLKNSAGELVNYRDTPDTRRMRRFLAEANEHLATLRIDVPDAERRGRHMVFNDNCYVLPEPGNGLYRVFSRGSFDLHGRAGWWQNIPKTARQSLTINDEPVVEADYRSLHPTILYAGVGDPRLAAMPMTSTGSNGLTSSWASTSRSTPRIGPRRSQPWPIASAPTGGTPPT